ncbi:hypothetical protein PJI17_13180 [Mycobacterium kansasii]
MPVTRANIVVPLLLWGLHDCPNGGCGDGLRAPAALAREALLA